MFLNFMIPEIVINMKSTGGHQHCNSPLFELLEKCELLSTLKLCRNWLGLMTVSGLEAPDPSPPLLVRAISTSSTVMG